MKRRNFVKTSALAGMAGLSGINLPSMSMHRSRLKSITIESVDSDFEREPLIRPFGFKGIYQKEFWVSAARLASTSGRQHVGLMTQCLAWSDLDVFMEHSEAAGNMLIHNTLEYALRQIKGATFRSPVELQETILEDTHAYGQKITGHKNLRKTFTLSSLVALDSLDAVCGRKRVPDL